MSISLNQVGIGGTILLWLGIVVCVVSATLYFGISSGIADGKFAREGSFDETSTLTFHHTDFLLIGWKGRLLFLLPLAAGVALTVSGVAIRGKIPEFRAMLQSVGK